MSDQLSAAAQAMGVPEELVQRSAAARAAAAGTDTDTVLGAWAGGEAAPAPQRQRQRQRRPSRTPPPSQSRRRHRPRHRPLPNLRRPPQPLLPPSHLHPPPARSHRRRRWITTSSYRFRPPDSKNGPRRRSRSGWSPHCSSFRHSDSCIWPRTELRTPPVLRPASSCGSTAPPVCSRTATVRSSPAEEEHPAGASSSSLSARSCTPPAPAATGSTAAEVSVRRSAG